MSKHECLSCGESFDSLTRKRLHERDECDEKKEHRDVSDRSKEDLAQEVTDELFECENCGKTEKDREIPLGHDVDPDVGIVLSTEWTCECGYTNHIEIIAH